MGGHRRGGAQLRAAVPELPARAGWTGRIGCEVTTPKGGYLGHLDLVLEDADVQVVYAGRRLAVLDRARLRRWLRRPVQPLASDDVVLDLRGRRLTMAMDMASPYPLPDRVLTQLAAVV